MHTQTNSVNFMIKIYKINLEILTTTKSLIIQQNYVSGTLLSLNARTYAKIMQEE